jgi:hypothetical protein
VGDDIGGQVGQIPIGIGLDLGALGLPQQGAASLPVVGMGGREFAALADEDVRERQP